MPVIKIKSKLRDYEVRTGAANEFVTSLVNLENKAFVIDENVWHLYADSILCTLPKSETLVFPALEEKKTLEGVQEIYEFLLKRSAKRNLTLVTIGGGILQDVTGFAASTLYRGINWIFVPTTLLAQADSCIGSKTSLNYKGYKNLIGSFYPPSTVWIDPAFLKTLQTQDFYSGLGEVVKLHIMGGEEKIQQLIEAYDSICALDFAALQHAIQTSLEIKIDYITGDEFDLGRRNMLNYGHCFGHAIESASDFRIPHGQAVVAGMMLANYISSRRGLLSVERSSLIERKLLTPSLKMDLQPRDLKLEAIIEAMGKDKKRTGRGLALVMLTDLDEMVRVDDLDNLEVQEVLTAFGNTYKNEGSLL